MCANHPPISFTDPPLSGGAPTLPCHTPHTAAHSRIVEGVETWTLWLHIFEETRNLEQVRYNQNKQSCMISKPCDSECITERKQYLAWSSMHWTKCASFFCLPR